MLWKLRRITVGLIVLGSVSYAASQAPLTRSSDFRESWGSAEIDYSRSSLRNLIVPSEERPPLPPEADPETLQMHFTPGWVFAVGSNRRGQRRIWHMERPLGTERMRWTNWGGLPSGFEAGSFIFSHGAVWLLGKRLGRPSLYRASIHDDDAIWSNAGPLPVGHVSHLQLLDDGRLAVEGWDESEHPILRFGEFLGGGKRVSWSDADLPLSTHSSEPEMGTEPTEPSDFSGEVDLQGYAEILTLSWQAHTRNDQRPTIRYRISPSESAPYGPWSTPVSKDSVKIGRMGRYIEYQIQFAPGSTKRVGEVRVDYLFPEKGKAGPTIFTADIAHTEESDNSQDSQSQSQRPQPQQPQPQQPEEESANSEEPDSAPFSDETPDTPKPSTPEKNANGADEATDNPSNQQEPAQNSNSPTNLDTPSQNSAGSSDTDSPSLTDKNSSPNDSQENGNSSQPQSNSNPASRGSEGETGGTSPNGNTSQANSAENETPDGDNSGGVPGLKEESPTATDSGGDPSAEKDGAPSTGQSQDSANSRVNAPGVPIPEISGTPQQPESQNEMNTPEESSIGDEKPTRAPSENDPAENPEMNSSGSNERLSGETMALADAEPIQSAATPLTPDAAPATPESESPIPEETPVNLLDRAIIPWSSLVFAGGLGWLILLCLILFFLCRRNEDRKEQTEPLGEEKSSCIPPHRPGIELCLKTEPPPPPPTDPNKEADQRAIPTPNPTDETAESIGSSTTSQRKDDSTSTAAVAFLGSRALYTLDEKGKIFRSDILGGRFRTSRRVGSAPIPCENPQLAVVDGTIFFLAPSIHAGVSQLFSAPIDSRGAIGRWNTLSLPRSLCASSTLWIEDNHLFLIGQENNRSVVCAARMEAGHLAGDWSHVTDLPPGLRPESAVITDGRCLIAGRYARTDLVEVLAIALGNANVVSRVGRFNNVRGRASLVTGADRVILLDGGDRPGRAQIYEARINDKGRLLSWDSRSAGFHPVLSSLSGIVVGDRILVAGRHASRSRRDAPVSSYTTYLSLAS
ncbi:MAG: hypothetical protein ABIH23_36475 [bacterium]